MMTTADPFVQFASKGGSGCESLRKKANWKALNGGGSVVQAGQENCLWNELDDTRWRSKAGGSKGLRTWLASSLECERIQSEQSTRIIGLKFKWESQIVARSEKKVQRKGTQSSEETRTILNCTPPRYEHNSHLCKDVLPSMTRFLILVLVGILPVFEYWICCSRRVSDLRSWWTGRRRNLHNTSKLEWSWGDREIKRMRNTRWREIRVDRKIRRKHTENLRW